MADAHLRMLIDAKNEKNARVVLSRFSRAVEAAIISLKPHRDGGFEASITLHVAAGSWPEQVVSIIGVAQTFGRGWALTGNVEEAVDMTAHDFQVPGLRFAWLTLERSR